MNDNRESNKSTSHFFLLTKKHWRVRWRIVLEKVLLRFGVSPSVAREGGGIFVLRILNIGLSFVSTVILSRLLGAQGYGVYAYAYALVTLLSVPAEFGLPNLIVRETAKGTAMDRPDLVQGVWRWSVKFVSIIAFVLVFFVGPILLFWRGGLNSVQGSTLAWALILIPLIALSNLRGAALRGLKKIVAGQIPDFVIRPGTLVFLLGIVLFTGQHLSPSLAMILHVLAATIAFLVGVWILRRNTPLVIRQARPSTATRGWLTSSILFALISGFGVINNQASTVILGLFKASDQVGIYRVAVQVSALASFGLQTVNLMVAPRFADLYAQKKMARLQRLVINSSRVILIFNLAFTLLFISLGRSFFVLVFGSDFTASYLPLIILLVGQLLNSAAGSVGYLLSMTGHERDATQGLGVAAVANLVLNLLLVPLWGIQGAAMATAVSMVMWNILLWLKVHQRLGINSLAFSSGGKSTWK